MSGSLSGCCSAGHGTRSHPISLVVEEKFSANEEDIFGGRAESPNEAGRYIDVNSDPADPHIILQQVEHPSRIHIDIETDDIAAEVTRLEALGATVVEIMERWTVMEAPSKHRFCIIGVRRDGFDENANVWE